MQRQGDKGVKDLGNEQKMLYCLDSINYCYIRKNIFIILFYKVLLDI